VSTVREQWVEALRSGKYIQRDRALRRGDGMCCHGVLLDIVDPDGWTPPPDGGTRWQHRLALDGGTFMPKISWFRETVGPGISAYQLSDANDAGKTFDQIADIIERA
jgi:hypothetical protein